MFKNREDARGVVSATPKFRTLLYKLGSEILLPIFLFTVCYLHHFKISTILPVQKQAKVKLASKNEKLV